MWRRPAPWPARRAGGRSWSRTWAARGGWRSSRSTIGPPPRSWRSPRRSSVRAGRPRPRLAPCVRPAGARGRPGVPTRGPWALGVPQAELADAAAEAAAELDKEDGTLAVVVPRSRLAAVAEAVGARLPGTSPGTAPDLTAGPVVLPPEGAKGLEFDSVLVVDPRGILDEGVRGHNDLYVALTRATQRLGVVHPGDLPTELAGLEPRS